jgi:lysophospholipase L1-like esterase
MNSWNGSSRAALLSDLELGYPLLALGLLVLTGLAAAALVFGRRLPRRARSILARGTLVGATTLIGLILAESTVAVYLSWLHRAPRLAMVDAPARQAAANDDATIVVVGESSAEGVPYRDWFSVGKIVVWQLRRLFPQRMFHLEVQARAGWTLEQMHQKLAESRHRPDAVILYAGHNEFSSRYGWSSEVPHYWDSPRPCWPLRLAASLSGHSPLCRLLRESQDQALVAARPPLRRRLLADAPSHSAAHHHQRLEDFRRRLEIILADLKKAGVLTILIVPPGNDAGFEPNRSVLPPQTPRAEQDAFCRAVQEARALEPIDPLQSIQQYRGLIARQPGCAETHFRLARLLERAGTYEEAYREYILARDLDGHPMRCLTSFQDVYRELAPRYDAILVDGQAVFHARHPHGLLDDSLFNDGMHPSFEGYVALAESVLAGLRERQAFGWPPSCPAPSIDLADCASHFDITTATWKEVCRFAAGFYRTTLRIRFDPEERETKARRHENGLRRLEDGASPDLVDLAGVGIRPVRCRIGPAPALTSPTVPAPSWRRDFNAQKLNSGGWGASGSGREERAGPDNPSRQD